MLRTATIGTATSAPMMPGEDQAGGDRKDHRERMDGHRPTHDQRLEDVPFELLYADHHGQYQQRGDRPAGDQRDEDGDRTGQGGADDRDEGTEEDQRGQREGQVDPEDEQADADAECVDERDQDRRPDVGDECQPGLAARRW